MIICRGEQHNANWIRAMERRAWKENVCWRSSQLGKGQIRAEVDRKVNKILLQGVSIFKAKTCARFKHILQILTGVLIESFIHSRPAWPPLPYAAVVCYCRMYHDCWTSAGRVSSSTLLPTLQHVLVLSAMTQTSYLYGSRTAMTLPQMHHHRLATETWQWICDWITQRHGHLVLRLTSVRSSCYTFIWLSSR